MQAFSDAQFLRAVGRPGELPPAGPPEIAFAGRSNVGKSSAINALVGRHRLARTSKTPGRTQTINFYRLGGEREERLVDLPGYGYARVPQPLRLQWEKLVSAYIRDRANLAGIVVIMDARHPLTPLDRQLLGWLGGARTLALLSKADKLGRADQAATLKGVKEALDCEVMLFSSTSRQGVEECRARLVEWLDEADSRK
jgi:GTP-binding protein